MIDIVSSAQALRACFENIIETGVISLILDSRKTALIYHARREVIIRTTALLLGFNKKQLRMSKRKTKTSLPETASDAVIAKPVTAKELAAAIRKSGLIGMWKDRTDITDSSKFARKLRNQASKR